MVPNTAGSGYDTTARAAAKVMDDTGATENVEVFNLAGAGGTVGLARTVNEKGNGKLADDDGPRRGRSPVHQQVDGQARPDHPDRQADRGVRRHRGRQGLPVHRRSTTSSTAWKANPKALAVGGGSVPGRSRPPAADAAGPDGRASTPSRSTSSPTTAAVTCSRPSSAARSPSAPRASASSSTRSRPARSASRPPAEPRTRRRRRRPDPEGVRHRPGVHQLARHRRAPGAQRRRQAGAGSTRWRRCTTARSGRTCWRRTAGPTPTCRRRVRDLPHRADQAGRGRPDELGLA